MLEGFNIAQSDADGLFPLAIMTSPDYPDTDSFDLFNLGRHDILEHDISLRYTSLLSLPSCVHSFLPDNAALGHSRMFPRHSY
jgi:hypothetical protein